MTRIGASTPDAPPPAGAYSQSVRIGDLIAVSGQGGIDPVTNELVDGGFEPQMDQTFANIEAALSASGASLDDVLKVTVYLTTPGDFPAMNDRYAQYWQGDPPARTTVSVVLSPGLLIEVDVLAVKQG